MTIFRGERYMIKVGILGSGFGREHARLLQLHDDVDVVGIFGRNTERLKAIEDEFGIRGVTDSNELLQDPSIDVIDVCVPSAFHHKYVIGALRQQKHVWCEVPLSYSLAEAEEMMAEARQANRHLLVNQFSKFFPAYQHIHQFLRDGHAGKVLAAQQSVGISASQNNGPGIDTIVSDLMSIQFDFSTWLFGLPDTVRAFATTSIPPNRASVSAVLSYGDMNVVEHASSMMPEQYPFTRHTLLHGEKGTIEFNFRILGDWMEHRCLFYPVTGEARDLGVTHCYPHQAALNHMVDVISGKAQDSPLSIQHAIAAVRVAVAVNQSLE
jgi:predicted dehydrogenase